MKKLLATSLSAIAIFTSFVPVAAEDTKSVTVNYSVNESYEWSVPSGSINLSAAATDQKVKVTKNMIEDGKKLQITVKSANDFYAVDSEHSSNKLKYELKNEETVLENGGIVLEVNAGTNTAEMSISWGLIDEITKSGDYVDTLTYTATVVDQEEEEEETPIVNKVSSVSTPTPTPKAESEPHPYP